jgi:hypothetical protein
MTALEKAILAQRSNLAAVTSNLARLQEVQGYRLVKAPFELIDYVILHEVAHIKHHDHGRGFERLMDIHLPNWRECRRDLNTLGATILVD